MAQRIGVSDDSITYWENHRYQPQIQYYPKLIEFLGYFPFEIDTSTLVDKLKEYQFKNGLRQKKVEKLLGVNEPTIFSWERNKNTPLKKHMKKLLELFK